MRRPPGANAPRLNRCSSQCCRRRARAQPADLCLPNRIALSAPALQICAPEAMRALVALTTVPSGGRLHELALGPWPSLASFDLNGPHGGVLAQVTYELEAWFATEPASLSALTTLVVHDWAHDTNEVLPDIHSGTRPQLPTLRNLILVPYHSRGLTRLAAAAGPSSLRTLKVDIRDVNDLDMFTRDDALRTLQTRRLEVLRMDFITPVDAAAQRHLAHLLVHLWHSTRVELSAAGGASDRLAGVLDTLPPRSITVAVRLDSARREALGDGPGSLLRSLVRLHRSRSAQQLPPASFSLALATSGARAQLDALVRELATADSMLQTVSSSIGYTEGYRYVASQRSIVHLLTRRRTAACPCARLCAPRPRLDRSWEFLLLVVAGWPRPRPVQRRQ